MYTKYLKINDAKISIRWAENRHSFDGRSVYHYRIKIPGHPAHIADDLKSGRTSNPTLNEGLENLLSFLGAAGESFDYNVRENKDQSDPDSNASLFPIHISEWASKNSDDITMEQIDLETKINKRNQK